MSNRAQTTADALLEHAQWAHALARRLVGDAASADDVVQEAYVAALKNPPAVPQGLRPWFGRVLTNVVRMQHRAKVRREARERSVGPDPTLPAADELAIRAEGQRTLVEAVLKLEEPYRSTVLLRYFEDLSAAEIARRQDIPAATVRWRLQEGLAMLRTELDRGCDGDTRSWCTLLLPLATMRAPGVLLAPVTHSLLSLVVIMKILKTATVVGVLAVALFYLAPEGLLPSLGFGSDELELAPAQVSFRAIEDTALDSDPSSSPEGDQRRPIKSTQRPISDQKPIATIRARFVDTRGRAIEGVSFAAADRPGGTSDAGGLVVVELVDNVFYGASDEAALIARHRSYANHRCFAAVTGEKITDLGTIVLQDGGSIHGRVVGEDGRPWQGAKVFVEADPLVEQFGDMRTSTTGHVGRAEATTDAKGEFHLRGVKSGFRTVQASAKPHMHVKSGKVQVRPGQESFGLELVLTDPTPPERRITGIVLDPDGKPVARSKIRWRYSTFFGFSNGAGSVITNRDGEFRINARDKSAKYQLMAKGDDQNIIGVIENARPGQHYTLKLNRPDSFDIIIQDAHGKPLPVVTLDVSPVKSHADSVQYFREQKTEQGTIKARVPLARFKITASALGHTEQEFGPFEPADIAQTKQILCTLSSAPVLRGTVTANGEPVKNAEVSLRRRCGQVTQHNGFPVWLKPRGFISTRTDAEGHWAVTLRDDKPFFLCVTAPGWANHMSQELPATRARDTEPLDVELDHGGSIHGQVIGPNATGTIIGISRGDGAAQTVRVAANGQFAFDDLTPGRYQVKRVDDEIRPDSLSTLGRWGTPYRETEWVCEVFAGQVTRYDLGTETRPTCTLTGRVRLGDAESIGWSASLAFKDEAGRVVPSTQLQTGGRFTLSVARPGDYRLLVQEDGQDVYRCLIADLTLNAGPNEFILDVETGTVTVAGIVKSPVPTMLLWEGENGVTLAFRLHGDANGRCNVSDVPSGHIRIVGGHHLGIRAAERLGDDLRKWPVLSKAELRAGAVAVMNL